MTVAVVVAAACAAAAVAVVCPRGPRTIMARRLGPATPVRSWRGPARLSGWPGRRPALVLGIAVAAVAVVGADALLLAAAAAILVAAAHHQVGVRRRSRQRTRLRRGVVEACEALSAELRAGQPAVRALHRVAEEHALVRPAAQAAELGGDVAAVLDTIGARPGAGGLRMVAAGWRLADRTGTGLAAVLDRIAGLLRAEEAAAAEVVASLAAPRATARILAVLPVFGLLLGAGLGGDPVRFLLRSTPGQLCLVGGCLLAAIGLWWVERIAATVEAGAMSAVDVGGPTRRAR